MVLFDQRGSGRSTPPASDPSTDLSVNTTHHLVRAWPGSELHLVGTGHLGGDEMTDRMIEALDQFAASS